MQVFSEGLPAEEAARIASRALESSSGLDESALCVDVASSRRHYGRLIAVHPAGNRFFPQENQLLTLYAKHAAAVLDTALALRDASRRHEHVSALLSLSQALARAGTTEEVADRLTEAVVDVVDCDRASTWIWDETAGALRREGTVGAPSESGPDGLGLKDTPHRYRWSVIRNPCSSRMKSTIRSSRRS